MVTTIDNHVLLPHLPNWQSPVSVQRLWQTAVERSVTGGEERLGMRPRPRLQLTFSLLPFSLAEQTRLLARLRAALKSGYAVAPHWGRGIAVLSASGRSIALSSDAWRYAGEDDWVLIRVPDFATPEAFETAKLTEVNGATLSLYANLTGTYGPGAVVWPLIFGHLICSDLDHGSNWRAGVQITLREFRPKQPPPTWEDICFIDPWGGCESWNNFADTAWTPNPDPAGHALGGITYTCLGDWTAFGLTFGLVETWVGLEDFSHAGASTQKVASGESWNYVAGWTSDWFMYSVAVLGAYDTFANLADGSVSSPWTGELNLLSGDEEGFSARSWNADEPHAFYYFYLYSGSSQRSNLTGKVGVTFTTDAAVPVSVGRMSRYKITGTGSHTLEVIKASTLATVASVTISNSGAPDNGAVEGILPAKVQLELNTKYYLVSSETSGGDPWRDYSGTASSTFRVSGINPVSYNGSTWTEIAVSGSGYAGLAFKA